MGKTKIEWCDVTWNPVSGCLHGCEYCYAKKIVKRFGSPTKDKNLHILQSAIPAGPFPYGFAPTLKKYMLDAPSKWKKAKNIFVCSMADLFGDWVPSHWIDKVITATETAPKHRYLFLTKNPKRYTEYGVPRDKNKWYGTTITNKKDACRFNRLPAFAHTFLSIEPLLEDFAKANNVMFRQVEWIILGAETGNRKGKITPQKEWVKEFTKEADRTGVPVFMKDSLIPVVGKENMRREFPW